MWHVGDCGVCVCVVGKMSEGIGMTIHKSVVVMFLTRSVAFRDSIPAFCDLFLQFFGGRGTKLWMVVVSQLQLLAM